MKKSSGQSPVEEPIGIVIAVGGKAPLEPRVRAYLWWNPDAPPAERAEGRG